MTVDCRTYTDEKQKFIKKHGKGDWRVETSPMDEYGVYYKHYLFDDGAIWYERMSPAWRKAVAEVEVEVGVKVKIEQDVKLFETEYWNSDNATSRKYYEKF